MVKEIKHYIDENNVYKIEVNGELIFTIELDNEYKSILATKYGDKPEVFRGRPDLISLTADVPF